MLQNIGALSSGFVEKNTFSRMFRILQFFLDVATEPNFARITVTGKKDNSTNSPRRI